MFMTREKVASLFFVAKSLFFLNDITMRYWEFPVLGQW